jgi:hypothetical protein
MNDLVYYDTGEEYFISGHSIKQQVDLVIDLPFLQNEYLFINNFCLAGKSLHQIINLERLSVNQI